MHNQRRGTRTMEEPLDLDRQPSLCYLTTVRTSDLVAMRSKWAKLDGDTPRSFVQIFSMAIRMRAAFCLN